MKFGKTLFLGALVVALTAFAIGCAITDYKGYLNHNTQSEAKLWGSQSAISGTGDSELDGTYEYTVKYDCRGDTTACPARPPGDIDITTYRNPVFAAFSRDGCVDRDGDDMQGRAGDLTPGCNPGTPAGKFMPQWLFEDVANGCQFFANLKNDYGNPPPLVAVCFSAPVEEVDKDFSLQGKDNLASFGSIDDLLNQIWNGAVGTAFSAEIDSVVINGNFVDLINAATVQAEHNGARPINASIDLSSAGGQELVSALLANTSDGVPASVTLNAVGGLSVGSPTRISIAFDHDGLRDVLN